MTAAPPDWGRHLLHVRELARERVETLSARVESLQEELEQTRYLLAGVVAYIRAVEACDVDGLEFVAIAWPELLPVTGRKEVP